MTVEVAQRVMTDTRRSWRSAAACRGLPTSMFFPDPLHPDPAGLAAARAVCRSCPVSEVCADTGASEPAGIWGGLTTTERRSRRLTSRPAA